MKVYRPAGNRILLQSRPFPPEQISDKPLRFYQSGTAALAAALSGCKQLSAERNEVIIPGYACPDLLSAIHHIGARPILADLAPNSHRFDLEALSRLLGPHTLAVISLRFLGLADDYPRLRSLLREEGVFLIMDSAQWFPCQPSPDDWPGDYNILSFGRGKPVNLLHGGAVICRDDRYYKALPTGRESPLNQQPDRRHRLKIHLYNRLIHPVAYGLVSRLPGLHIGITRYHPLDAIERMSEFHRSLLAANLQYYRSTRAVSREWRRRLDRLDTSGWRDMTKAYPENELPALLRYPLWIENEAVRGRFLAATHELGVSALYQTTLPNIPGIPPMPQRFELPNAARLAQSLVTLPTHQDISSSVIERIIEQLRQALGHLSAA